MSSSTFSLIRGLQVGCISLAIGATLSAQPPTTSPWQRAESSKALFESLGLKLDEVEDGNEESDKDLELYLRILSRLQQLPKGMTHDWAKDQPESKAIELEPAKFRGEIFRLEGNLKGVDRVELPRELSDRFDVKSLYRLMFAIPKAGPPPDLMGQMHEEVVYVWSTHMPTAVRAIFPPLSPYMGKEEKVSRVSVEAVFVSIVFDNHLKNHNGKLTFVANHVAWYPERESEEFQITNSHAALGRANFDLGLLDAVKAEKSKRLTPEVTEPFLQMLAAQSNVDGNSLKAARLNLAQIVDNPNSQIGEAIEFDAIARRVVEVPIDSESDRKRLNLDRYFQIDLVIPKAVRTLVKDKDGKQQEVEQSNFPMTLCVTEPPTDLATGSGAAQEFGGDIREPVHVKAFFFKLWAYESKFAQAHSVDSMQVSPLFIGARIQKSPPPEVSSTEAIWFFGGVIAFLGGITVWGFILLRGDDKSELRKKAARREASMPVEITPKSDD